MFLRQGTNLVGAEHYGPPLTYDISLPGANAPRSQVKVEFAILPIENWHSLSTQEKNQFGISKGAGVSVIRLSFGILHSENLTEPAREILAVAHQRENRMPTLGRQSSLFHAGDKLLHRRFPDLRFALD
jgi:hypothetical protein